MMRDKDWNLYCIILDKTTLIHHVTLRNNTHQLYNVLANNLLGAITVPVEEKIIHLHVDRSKEQGEIEIFDRFMRENLKNNVPKSCTLNIDHLRSQNDPGLQAVDLFCYGIARKYERNDLMWYKIFESKIKRELIFRA